MNKVVSVLLISLLGLAMGTISPGAPYSTKIGDQTIEQSIYFYNQKVDHFDPSNTAFFNQRFTVYDAPFNPVNGTVFIFIGGEGPQLGLTTGSGWYMQVAQQMSAMVILVEHRFYGVSQPFGQGDNTLSVNNLQFLTVDQSLADLASFIAYLKDSQFLGVSSKNPFITVGGSYPGAMSAWFRYKYPHLTVGAHASSAVVNSILDFQQYDYQIYTSTSLSGPECPLKIQRFNTIVEEILTTNSASATSFRALFNAQDLTVKEFLSYFGDLWAGMVQYGKRTQLCDFFKPDTFDEQLKNVVQYAITDKNQLTDDYQTSTLKNEKYDPQSSGRQWTWQVCTFFGWFQTANAVQPMRSKLIDAAFYADQCNQAFQGFSDYPQSDLTNIFYGGKNLNIKNIVFTNGVEDEWQWASIRYPQGNMQSIISDCTDCGHCVEFRLPKPTDSPQLQATRAAVLANFQKWTAEFFAKQPANFVQKKLQETRQ